MLSHMAETTAQRIRGFAWGCAAASARWSFRSGRRWRRTRRARLCRRRGCRHRTRAAMGDFPGGMLIGAEKGLFLARAAGGKVTVTPVRGDRDAERVLSIQPARRRRAGRGLEGRVRGARGGRALSLAPVPVDPDTGPCLRCAADCRAGVLVGAAKDCSWRARRTASSPSRGRRHRTAWLDMFDFPGGGVLIRAGKGWFLARAASGKVTLAPVATARRQPTASGPCAPCAASAAGC